MQQTRLQNLMGGIGHPEVGASLSLRHSFGKNDQLLHTKGYHVADGTPTWHEAPTTHLSNLAIWLGNLAIWRCPITGERGGLPPTARDTREPPMKSHRRRDRCHTAPPLTHGRGFSWHVHHSRKGLTYTHTHTDTHTHTHTHTHTPTHAHHR